MPPKVEVAQLPLSVSVSPWSGFLYRLKKSLREFKYTPPIQVFSNFLFWVNAGVVGFVYLLIQYKERVINSGIGVIFSPGSRSSIPLFVASSVRELIIIPYIWYGMVVVFGVFAIGSMAVHFSGRYGMTSYLLAISLILLLLMAKIIVVPLLLIGG